MLVLDEEEVQQLLYRMNKIMLPAERRYLLLKIYFNASSWSM